MVVERERMKLLMEPIVTLIVKIGTLRPRQQKGVLSKFQAANW